MTVQPCHPTGDNPTAHCPPPWKVVFQPSERWTSVPGIRCADVSPPPWRPLPVPTEGFDRTIFRHPRPQEEPRTYHCCGGVTVYWTPSMGDYFEWYAARFAECSGDFNPGPCP
jgi:hypothetical protein